jgi:hypothetical protein
MLDVITGAASSNGGLLAHWYEIAGIIVAVPIVAVIVWKLLAFFGHVQGVHESIVGKPATTYSEAIPSIIERFKITDAGVTDAKEMARAAAELAADTILELHPNGGASFRDSLDRNERVTIATGEQVDKLVKRVDDHIVEDSRAWGELSGIVAGLKKGQAVAARDRADIAATAVQVAADVAQTAIDTATGVAQTAVDTAADVKTTAEDTAAGVAKTVVDVADELHRTGP